MERRIPRGILACIGAVIGCALVMLVDSILYRNGVLPFNLLFETWGLILIYAGAGLCFAIIFSFILPKPIEKLLVLLKKTEEWLTHSPITDVFIVVMGLILGLLVALLLSTLIRIIPIGWIAGLLSAAVYVLCGYLGVLIAVRRRNELAGAGLPIGRRGQAKLIASKQARPKILDTSVIIDGRIYDICKTGVMEGELLIPEFVLRELRHIADSADALKRGRGRRGLDILAAMQEELPIPVRVVEKDYPDVPEVDLKLLRLATDLSGVVITNDFNLNKVAGVQNVPVFNMNDLANALKPLVSTGEELRVSIVKEGKEANQGVAYLDDGTMIVVENGKRCMGEQAEVIVTSVLQTSAGRMIFAKIKA